MICLLEEAQLETQPLAMPRVQLPPRPSQQQPRSANSRPKHQDGEGSAGSVQRHEQGSAPRQRHAGRRIGRGSDWAGSVVLHGPEDGPQGTLDKTIIKGIRYLEKFVSKYLYSTAAYLIRDIIQIPRRNRGSRPCPSALLYVRDNSESL